MSDIESFAAGLANGINSYLGQQGRVQGQAALNQQESDLMQQRQSSLSNLNLNNDQKLELYKQTLAGKVDTKTASMLSPDGADMVNNFNQQNGRMPTIDEFNGLLSDKPDNSKQIASQQKTLLSVQKNYQSAIKKEEEAGSAVNTAGDQIKLALNNPVAYSSVPITLARMMTGTSRINVQEINRLGGSQAVLAKLKQIGTTMTSGTLTPENAQYMSDLTDVLKTSHQQNIEDLGVHHASMYRRISGQDLPSAYKDVTGTDMPDRFNHPLGNPNIQTTSDIEQKKAALRTKLGL